MEIHMEGEFPSQWNSYSFTSAMATSLSTDEERIQIYLGTCL